MRKMNTSWLYLSGIILSLAGCGAFDRPSSGDDRGEQVLLGSSTSARVRLFRLWNRASADHFYTISTSEKNSSIQKYGYAAEDFESIYIYAIVGDGRVPLYRYYSGPNGDHFYTTSEGGVHEISPGYYFEGIAGYVYKAGGDGRVRLYRYWSKRNTDHFYTTTGGGAPTYQVGQTSWWRRGGPELFNCRGC